MIRPLDWRDLAMLHRMRSHGLCLDSQLDSTRGPDAFHDALMDPFSRRRSTHTLIARPDDSRHAIAVGQFTHHINQVFAHLTFLGPEGALSQPSGMHLIDALSQLAGTNKIHHLIAEIDERNNAFEVLRRAGFAVYARQRIWQYIGSLSVDIENVNLEWRLESDADASAIRNLYHNLVPGLVQQVENPPTSSNRNLVHWALHSGRLTFGQHGGVGAIVRGHFRTGTDGWNLVHILPLHWVHGQTYRRSHRGDR